MLFSLALNLTRSVLIFLIRFSKTPIFMRCQYLHTGDEIMISGIKKIPYLLLSYVIVVGRLYQASHKMNKF